MSTKNLDDLTLFSRFEEVEKVEPYLQSLQEQLKFSKELFSTIQLALTEAVTNAIMHGNKQDTSKKVHVASSVKDQVLTIEVQDKGPGFDATGIPDPRKEENLLKESGRGLFLIKQYADKIKISKNPSVLTMYFSLSEVN